MLGDSVPQRQNRSVISPPAVSERTATVRFISHAGGAVKGGPAIPVAGVKQVESFADEIWPGLFVEGGGIRFSERIQPLERIFLREVRVDRLRRRRKEIFPGLPMVIGQDLRMPFQERPGRRL